MDWFKFWLLGAWLNEVVAGQDQGDRPHADYGCAHDDTQEDSIVKLPVHINVPAAGHAGVTLAGVTAEYAQQYGEECVIVRGEVRSSDDSTSKKCELVVTVYNSCREVVGVQRDDIRVAAGVSTEPFESTLQCSQNHGAPATVVIRASLG